MNDKFFDLKKEKQDRMINAAMKVFALQGYRHASTDDIVREAAISKGLLFHYFESKLGVYTFMYDYGMRYMLLELNAVSAAEKDLFELMKQVESARMRAVKGYPYLQQFLDRCMTEDVEEARLAVEEKRNRFVGACDAIYARADDALLPAGVDGDKLRKVLTYVVKGLAAERFREENFRPEALYEETCQYLDMIRDMLTSSSYIPGPQDSPL